MLFSFWLAAWHISRKGITFNCGVVNRELIIDSGSNGAEIALLEDKVLVELHQEKLNQNIAIGDIILAKVGKILPGLNAAFVDIGQPKNGFLHYSDLGPQVRSAQKFTKLAIDGVMPPDLNDFKLEPETQKTGILQKMHGQ